MGAIDYQNRNVSLDALASSTANARAMGKGKGIEALAVQIHAQGLIQPLTVFKVGGKYHVDAGHRRLAAIRLLAERGEWDAPVPCRVIPASASDADRRAISYVENLGQLPMHPLDKMRVLSGFVRRGLDAGQIAARFGITEDEVGRTLTLSNLALPIRKALAEGRLSEDRAFIYASADRGTQMAVFNRFGMVGDPRVIRSTLRQGQGHNSAPMSTADRLYKLVSEEYDAAGGTVASDLFSAHGTVDGGLVRKLVEAKLRETVATEADAWEVEPAFSIVSLHETGHVPGAFEWEDTLAECPVPLGIVVFPPRWGGIGSAAIVRDSDWTAYEEAQRAKAAEAEADAAEDEGGEAPEGWTHVDTSTEDEDGDGLDTTEAEPAAPAYDPEAEARDPSRPMLEDVGSALTAALIDRLSTDPKAALDAFLYTALVRCIDARSPLQMSLGSTSADVPEWLAVGGEFGNSDPAAVWARIDGLTEAQKMDAFAFFIGGAARANPGIHYSPPSKPGTASRMLANRLGIDMHADWSTEDRKSYLGRMTKRDLARVVLGLDGDEAEAAQAMGKAELVERAMSARWVPPFFAGIEAEAPAEVEPTEAEEAEAEPTEEAEAAHIAAE